MHKLNIIAYKQLGLCTSTLGEDHDTIAFLQEQADSIIQDNKKVRPWLLWELHNPWGRSARCTDSWLFLDLCQSKTLLNAISPLVGENIILYDSQFAPDMNKKQGPEESWTSDSLRCPVEPLAGLVVRIVFPDKLATGLRFIYRPLGDENIPLQQDEQSIALKPGLIIFHDIKLQYRFEGLRELNGPMQYVIRYFPASSQYQRDPTSKVHKQLTEQFPLLNYAQLPLWLSQGEDQAGNDFVTGFQPKAGRWMSSED